MISKVTKPSQWPSQTLLIAIDWDSLIQPDVLFSLLIWLFFYLVVGQICFRWIAEFWLSLQLLDGEIGEFLWDLSQCFVCKQTVQIHVVQYITAKLIFRPLCKVFVTNINCFSPGEFLYLVRLQWSVRHVTDQCGLEVAGVTFSDSDSAPVQKYLNPDPSTDLKSFQIWESD